MMLKYHSSETPSRNFVHPASPPSGGGGNKGLSASLGISQNYKTPPPLESPVLVHRLERYALQNIARKCLPDQRVAKCTRSPIGHIVRVVYNQKRCRHNYRSLETCSSVWVCPICSTKISEKRKNELSGAIKLQEDRGGCVMLWTVTIQHSIRDSYKKNLDSLGASLVRLIDRTSGKTLLEKMGCEGRIRGLESTWGQNGWHPHFHLLLFLEKPLTPKEIAFYDDALSTLWRSSCLSSGLNLTNKYGSKLQDGSYAAAYVANWGLASELTKGHTKKSCDGYSAFDFLRVIEGTYKGNGLPISADQATELFREFAFTMKGKKQLSWSRCLADLLGIVKVKTDEEIINDGSDETEKFGIPDVVWRTVASVRNDYRGKLLNACDQGENAQRACLMEIYSLHNKSKEIKNEIHGCDG